MKIYILMPTYNDSSTIVYSLDSILSQNYKNYEIIIVDDGSTDDTKKVINNYKKKYDKDNKIKYIYQENKDQLNALKTACNYIKEENSLVYILHSDDLLDNPDVFKKAINYMKNNNYDAIISNVDTIDENGNLSGKIKINKLFKPFYFNKEAKNKKEVIKFFLRKRFTDIEITNNLYLNAIDNFYSKNTSRTIVIDEIPDDLPIYLGSDLRTFNKKIIENKLEKFYVNFLNEMQIGFDKIIINEKYKEKITNIVKFLSIYGSVEIVFKK